MAILFALIFSAVLATVTAESEPHLNPVSSARPQKFLAGGRGPERPADAEIQTKIEPFRSQVEEKVGGPLQEYTAISYQPQAVSGTNYYVKVRVAPNKFVEVQFGEPLHKKGEKVTGRFHGATAL
ncbi:hypothetical protein BV898_15233 [Hypsibius exemplaris]|uniref:Cystatin domain-containing protein n=1 Tax=Hypsibius exemplaris TaxID=2072580 RepID=A0A9X6NHG2_HYPEX|nr:hypothetical protein BV898_15233 [Hypsibius exemplaris]